MCHRAWMLVVVFSINRFFEESLRKDGVRISVVIYVHIIFIRMCVENFIGKKSPVCLEFDQSSEVSSRRFLASGSSPDNCSLSSRILSDRHDESSYYIVRQARVVQIPT